ncbi:hypothetical protein TWF694_009613 [Orbilia ellipsospora]|uniref:F-box domain-containing protein n=1 Tax=Orbilia ellipsospora TaxID=2528407 RepID=A0AAV9XHS3_9PEZI
MPSNLLDSSTFVFRDLQRLHLSFPHGTKFLNILGTDLIPGSLYRIFDACKDTLKAIRLEICAPGRGPGLGLTDLKNIFGGGQVTPISFPKLEELYLCSFIAPAPDLERLITSSPQLHCLWFISVLLYGPSFHWRKFVNEIVNPSRIDRLRLARFGGGSLFEIVPDPSQVRWNDIAGGSVFDFTEPDPDGWRRVKRYKDERLEPRHGWLVRETSRYEVFVDEEYPLFVYND